MNETIQTRVPPELKREAEALFSGMGLGLSDAIRMFLQQSINEGGIPFKPRAKRPNAETIAAMEEAESGGGTVYKNFNEWRARRDEDD